MTSTTVLHTCHKKSVSTGKVSLRVKDTMTSLSVTIALCMNGELAVMYVLVNISAIRVKHRGTTRQYHLVEKALPGDLRER